MAFVNFRAGLTVVRPISKPANSTVSWANTNFSGFRMMPLAPQMVSQLGASVNA